MKQYILVLLTALFIFTIPTSVNAAESSFRAQFSLVPAEVPRIDQLSYSLSDTNWSLTFGRLDLKYGPGVFGQMVLGPVTGLNGIAYSASLGGFSYTHFWADLDGTVERRLLGHRFEYNFKTLTVGASETMLLYGDLPFFFYTPLPIPFYALQHLSLKTGSSNNWASNIVMGIDVHWQPYDDVEFYAEYMADDYSLSVPATAPMRTGALLGAAYRGFTNGAELRIEYAKVNKFTYCHVAEISDYVYYGSAIGHWVGPDADILIAQYAWDASETVRLAPTLVLQRQGEGALGDRWSYAEDGPSPAFLTGEIEYWGGIKFGTEYRLSEHAVIEGYLQGSLVYKAAVVEAEWRFEPEGKLTLSVEL
ncbi:MAG TPA: hypothetical protein DCY84_07195 [Firmicutes bacterium]|nr:hypothetical protein [Bacillota bacterium]